MDSGELTRYSRQLMLPGFGASGQQSLKSATVMIVGMGGLGCPVATYLAASGVGRLILVDGDKVELSNLHRQVLYTTADLGRFKAEAAAERLLGLNSNLEIDVCNRRVSPQSPWFAGFLPQVDVVVDGTDNFSTRYAVNEMTVASRLPLIYGSVYRYSGEVSTFLLGDGPCYACLHRLPPPAGTTPNCAEGGVLGVLPGMIGMLQATEVLKLLSGVGQPLDGRLLSLDIRRTPSFREWSFRRRPDCHVCGAGQPPVVPRAIESEVPEVELAEYRAHLCKEGFLLVDIRSLGEHAFGTLRGSLALHGDELEAFLDKGPRPTVFACKSGGRSRALVAKLQAQGWNEVFSLAGNWQTWLSSEGESLVAY